MGVATVKESDEGGWHMAVGPVEFLVIGFKHPDFRGEIIAELDRLKDSDTVRVIDSLAVYKDAAGDMKAMSLSNLSGDEAIEIGAKIAALIGLGMAGEEGMTAGAVLGAELAAEQGVRVFTEETAWEMLDEMPNDSAAAFILLEHHWAVPLRDAMVRANGFLIAEDFISPVDMVEIGLLEAEEAEDLRAYYEGDE